MAWSASVYAGIDGGSLVDTGPQRNLSEPQNLSDSKSDLYLPGPASKGFPLQHSPSALLKNRTRSVRLRNAAKSRDAASEALSFAAIAHKNDPARGLSDVSGSFSETVHAIDAVARERRRIARDLHDHAGQYFVGIMLRLAALERRATDETVRASLHDLCTTVTRFGDELKAIYAGERCGVPRGCGLVAALANMSSQWEREVGIEVRFDCRLAECTDLDDATAEAVFRVVQEALTNVAKHALQASRVNVHLGLEDQMLKLVVEDDGLGTRPQAGPCSRSTRQHYGIVGMRERVAELGGHLEVGRLATKGMRLVATLPISKSADEPVGAVQ
jgi:signal transduction histidine kinase